MTNGVVERFNGSLRDEHLNRLEVAPALELADEAVAYRTLSHTQRPHEAFDFDTRSDGTSPSPPSHTYFQAASVQES